MPAPDCEYSTTTRWLTTRAKSSRALDSPAVEAVGVIPLERFGPDVGFRGAGLSHNDPANVPAKLARELVGATPVHRDVLTGKDLVEVLALGLVAFRAVGLPRAGS